MRTFATFLSDLRTLVWACLLVVTCFPSAGFGHIAASASKREVLLRTGTIEVTEEVIQRPRPLDANPVPAVDHHVPFRRSFNSFAATASIHSEHDNDFRKHTQYFLHVKGPVTEILRDRLVLALAPYSIDSYLPHNTFLVVGPAVSHPKYSEFSARILNVPGVLSLLEREPRHKVAPELASLQQLDARERRVTGTRPSTESTHVELVLSVSHGVTRLVTPRDLAAEWHSVLQSELGHSNVEVRPVSATALRARVPVRDAHQAIAALSRQQQLSFVEMAPKFELQNAHARYVIQDDIERQTRFWDHRIDGSGQIIAIGDTGVDYDSCFFSDPHQDIVFGAGQHNFQHRKIVSYVTFGMAGDEAGGHGTHVAGTVAGEVEGTQTQKDTLGLHNGMAPKAKLAIYDFKSPGSEDLRVPENIYDLFFGESYENAAARITSNSWGAPEGTYSEYAVATDSFVYRHRNFLPIFAAGNYGSKGAMSISSPGVCKNVLTVGSSRSSSASFFELGYGTALEVVHPPELARKYSVAFAQFGIMFSQMRALVGMGVTVASPIDACAPLTNSTLEPNRRILLVQRGNCIYLQKARNAQAAGAVLMIVVQNENSPIDHDGMGGEDPAITIPSVLVSKSDGDPFFAQVDQLRISAPVKLSNNDLDEFHLSSFSSRGPTTDGRRKPDVLTPGEWITSVNSDGDPRSNNCPLGGSAVLKMEGTSMATPVAAGAAALVRQYFFDGFYPSGNPRREDRFDPSASLVKAMLIHSGDAIGGFVGGDFVTPPPSYLQGFGRIKLGNVLWVNDSRLLQPPYSINATYQPPEDPAAQYNYGWNLFVHDESKTLPNRTRPELSTFDHDIYCFRVSNSSADQFKVTLVWSDYPGDTSAALQLVNNLDLQVTHSESGRSWVGNQISFSDNQGSHLLWDELNNVEQITVTNAVGHSSPQYFSVHVYATQINQDAQSYSLVVTGNIESMPDASLCAGASVCPNNCSYPFGACTEWGHCACDSNHTGADCSISSVELLPVPISQITAEAGSFVAQEWRGSSTVALEGWSYFHLEITPDVLANTTDQLRIQMKRTGEGSGDPDLYISFNDFPSLHKHTWAVTDCDSCQGAAPSALSLDSTQIRVGVLRIGVYGYCCSSSAFVITMQIGSFAAPRDPVPSGVNPNSNLLMLVATCVGAALVVFLIACACVRSGCKDKLCHYFSPLSSVRALTQPGPRFAPLQTFPQVPHPPVVGTATELVGVDPDTHTQPEEGLVSMVGPGVVVMTSHSHSAPFRPPPPPGEPPAHVVAATATANALAPSASPAPPPSSTSEPLSTNATETAGGLTRQSELDGDQDAEGGFAGDHSNERTRRGYASVRTEADENVDL